MQYVVKKISVFTLVMACGVAGCESMPTAGFVAADKSDRASEASSSTPKTGTAVPSASPLRQAGGPESPGGLRTVQHGKSEPKSLVDENGNQRGFVKFEDDPANRQLTVRKGETLTEYETRIAILNRSKKPLSKSEMEVVRGEIKKTPEGKAMDEALQRGKAYASTMEEQRKSIKTNDDFPSFIGKIRSVELGDDVDTVVKKLGKPSSRMKFPGTLNPMGASRMDYDFISKDQLDPQKILAMALNGGVKLDNTQCVVWLDETDKVKSVTVTRSKVSGSDIASETLYSKGLK
jgi:hypothetical protein